MSIRAIIPAAGKGSRLHSDAANCPKAMRMVGGRPLLEYVLENTSFIKPEDTCIIVGYLKEQIMDHFGPSYRYAEQKELCGTGQAVMACEDQFRDFDGTVLITFGDMPLFRYETMKAMCEYHESVGAACTLMTAENDELESWARIVCDKDGRFEAIVEGRDCTPEQEKIKELFAGVLVFDSKKLFSFLPQLGCDNAQNEYYLTEIPELMARAGLRVERYRTDDGNDLRGVNSYEDIAVCEKILSERAAQRDALLAASH
ncbi:MAG: NTP transferase domain-containing protein [Clostridia bacterium]|nr:NTP transferase domain-containing protein [Clostridia bacterium]